MGTCGYTIYTLYQKLEKGVKQETRANSGGPRRRDCNCNIVERVAQRQLDNHLNEYLIAGVISTDKYWILTIFGGRTLADVQLSVTGFTGRAELLHGLTDVSPISSRICNWCVREPLDNIRGLFRIGGITNLVVMSVPRY